MNYLETLVNDYAQVITSEGRVFIGKLVSFDQMSNLVIQECKEKVYSKEDGIQIENMGVYLIRGDNVCLVSKLDMDKENVIDYLEIKVDPLPSIITHN